MFDEAWSTRMHARRDDVTSSSVREAKKYIEMRKVKKKTSEIEEKLRRQARIENRCLTATETDVVDYMLHPKVYSKHGKRHGRPVSIASSVHLLSPASRLAVASSGQEDESATDAAWVER